MTHGAESAGDGVIVNQNTPGASLNMKMSKATTKLISNVIRPFLAKGILPLALEVRRPPDGPSMLHAERTPITRIWRWPCPHHAAWKGSDVPR